MEKTQTVIPASKRRAGLKKAARLVCIMVLCLGLFVCSAFAAEAGTAAGAIETGIKNGTMQIYKIIQAIIIPIAAVIFAVNGIKMLGGEREMESAKKTMIICVVAIAVVLLAPVIVNQVGSWFSGSVDMSIFQ